MQFKDHFSDLAADYAKFRPRYPNELFGYLAAVAPDRECAWDCATGNGQAACGLAQFFEKVMATDASEKQIANAEPCDNVTYAIAAADNSGLPSNALDLVTIAQALHWLRSEEFFGEARRVLKPNGVLAIWCYNLCQISPPIDGLIQSFYRDTVGPFWDLERRLVETGYRSVPFPFEEFESPEFQMKADWSLNQVVGYLRTWSATKKFIAAKSYDPVTNLSAKIAEVWGNPAATRTVVWPLSVRVGKMSS